MGELFLGLVHYPALNKRGEVVATSVANLDIHDIARTAKTFGVSRYFIINPMRSQRRLAQRIIDHWMVGYGMSYNPDRAEALAVVSVVESLTGAVEVIVGVTGRQPAIVGTSARAGQETLSYGRLRRMLEEDPSPVLLLFGTGWGMAQELKETCAYMVEPIKGTGPYQHLSVRSAAAIVLDRLRGEKDTDRSVS